MMTPSLFIVSPRSLARGGCVAPPRRTWPGSVVTSGRAGGQRLHSDEIVRGRGEDEDPVHSGDAAVTQLPEQADGLHPPEDLFDALPNPLTHRIARMLRRPGIDRPAGLLRRDVRGGSHGTHGLDEWTLVKALVAADGLGAGRQGGDLRDGDVAFGRPVAHDRGRLHD